MNEEMEKCVLQNIPWANIPTAIKQVKYLPTYFKGYYYCKIVLHWLQLYIESNDF